MKVCQALLISVRSLHGWPAASYSMPSSRCGGTDAAALSDLLEGGSSLSGLED